MSAAGDCADAEWLGGALALLLAVAFWLGFLAGRRRAPAIAMEAARD